MLLLARTSLFALTTGTGARRAAVTRMAVTTTTSPRGNLGSSSEAEAAFTLDGGYGLQPGEDGTGGWLAHRSDLDTPGSGPGDDWVRRVFDDPDGDLASSVAFSPGVLTHPPRVLVLYGSLRGSSFSRKLAHECARVLELLGADVRVFDPRGLPVRDPELEGHPKVQELRALSSWSEAHVWVSPEMHGCITGAFKNQIDWLPLNSGSVRPTQGRTCAVLQVNGGSQSFNAVNELRRLARWMRMPCTTNQSSVPKAKGAGRKCRLPGLRTAPHVPPWTMGRPRPEPLGRSPRPQQPAPGRPKRRSFLVEPSRRGRSSTRTGA